MHILEHLDRFQLNDDLVFNKKVEAMLTNLVIAIEKRNRLLPNKSNSRWTEIAAAMITSVISRCLSSVPAFLLSLDIFRSFRQRRLFPSRDRVPSELSESIPPGLILPACIQVEAAVAQA